MEQQHMTQRIVKDIRNDNTLIEVTGYIKEIIDEHQIILDDTTGKIKINLENIELTLKSKI